MSERLVQNGIDLNTGVYERLNHNKIGFVSKFIMDMQCSFTFSASLFEPQMSEI